jgi:hypothetical protein
MFITTQNELKSLMPTARWDRPDQLFGYLEEEERVALEPLLGTALYEHLCLEYERLTDQYVDITATTVRPTGRAKSDPVLPYVDVTEQMDAIHSRRMPMMNPDMPLGDDTDPVPVEDMQAIRLIRICQQVEFYRMISHKAGLLTVSFNEGGGMNLVSAEGYDPADEKRMERVVRDAFMSAGRATDSLLLFLEADAKGDRLFTELWQEADTFWLHKDLLFQTARVMNEYLDIKGERMAYVELVRDIRFCQNTYLKPRIGGRLLKAVIDYANESIVPPPVPEPDVEPSDDDTPEDPPEDNTPGEDFSPYYDELLDMLRTALGFYVESRRTALGPKEEKLARRDSMTDAQQAMAMACQWVEDNLDSLGEAVVDTPIYKSVRERQRKEDWEREHREQAECRRRHEACRQQHKKLFTAFPHTHRTPELK